MKDILQDERPIRRLIFPAYPHFGRVIQVEEGGVTEIIAYAENGEMAPVTWFAVKADDKIVARVNSKHIEQVIY